MADITLAVNSGDPTTITISDLSTLNNGDLSAAGSVTDQTTDKDVFADFELNFTVGTALTANQAVAELYLCRGVDGTNLETVNTTNDTAPATARVGSFIAGTAATTMRCIVRHVPLPYEDFEVRVKNVCGYNFTAGTLKMLRYHYASA